MVTRVAGRSQGGRHMPYCHGGFRTVVTISPSEPLLAEVSWTLMRKGLCPKEPPEALFRHIDQSCLNAGDHGEVIDVLLLLVRYNDENLNGESLRSVAPENFKHDG